MNTPPIAPLFARIVDDLATHGWSQQTIFVPANLTKQLAAECQSRAQRGQLEPAAVGRGTTKIVHDRIRGDHIQWLDAGHDADVDRYLGLMEELRSAINQTLFLGLEEFESHFALYPPGAFYKKHVDRFRDDDRRVVTCVAYLNEHWLPEQGGELRMYLDNQRIYDVQPQAGTLMVFMSAQWPHEVLPATRDRLSITGWFLRRA